MTVFLCEDSLSGILTGVYEAWDSRLGHGNVRLETEREGNLELFCTYQTVMTDEEKAGKVFDTIRRRLGEETLEAVCMAAASIHERKADTIYRVLVLGLHMEDGKRVLHYIQNEDVSLVGKLRQKVWNEAHRLLGFLRFVELWNGILYARLDSPYAVLPLVAPHFADRLLQENWMIHDIRRGILAVHPANRPWALVEAKELSEEALEQLSHQEEHFQSLWRGFCESIAIKRGRIRISRDSCCLFDFGAL